MQTNRLPSEKHWQIWIHALAVAAFAAVVGFLKSGTLEDVLTTAVNGLWIGWMIGCLFVIAENTSSPSTGPQD
jgi:hypothetical protein